MADVQKPPNPDASKPKIRSASGIRKNPDAPDSTRRANLAPIPVAANQAGFRRRLVLGMIGLILVLSGMVAVRAIQNCRQTPREVLDVEALWKAAYGTAEESAKRIVVIESKTWLKGEALKPADYVAIDAETPVLKDCAARISDLLARVRDKTAGGQEAQETRDMDPALLRIRLWLLDATDLVASEKDPKKPQGVFVRMHKLLQELEEANADLRAAEEAQGAVVHWGSLDACREQQGTLQELVMKFAGLAEQHADLDGYIKKGLARDDLSAHDVPELGQLRGNATLATQQLTRARNMLLEVE